MTRLRTGATLINLQSAYKRMYQTYTDAEPGTYPDLWHKGRYRVELAAQLYGCGQDVDPVLYKQGYRLCDMDQWGRTYIHKGKGITAEVDELDEAGYLRLLLQEGGLEPEDITEAEDHLTALYRKIKQSCCSSDKEADYRPVSDLLQDKTEDWHFPYYVPE